MSLESNLNCMLWRHHSNNLVECALAFFEINAVFWTFQEPSDNTNIWTYEVIWVWHFAQWTHRSVRRGDKNHSASGCENFPPLRTAFVRLNITSMCFGYKLYLSWRLAQNGIEKTNTSQPQIAKFMGPTWGPPGSCRSQMGPMLVLWTLLSGAIFHKSGRRSHASHRPVASWLNHW